MNRPIEISNIGDYISQIDNITRSEWTYLYRGQENEDWQVNSSTYRRLNDQYGRNYRSDVLYVLWQRYLLQIVDEIKLRYPSTYRGLEPLECMAHLQHNKVATGLIDFTFSPLVGLWFACVNRDIDGKVIVIENDGEKIDEINTIGALGRDLETLFDANQEQWHLWSPTLDSQSVDTQRMIIQQSAFLFGLPEMDARMIDGEIIIPAEHKEKLRTELAKMGVSEETLFSDLLGFFERNSHQHSYDLTLIKSNDGETLL